MIIKKEKKGNVTIYYVDKDYGDDKIPSILNKKIKPISIKTIIDDDADVYTKEGNLLLRFRKNKLSKKKLKKISPVTRYEDCQLNRHLNRRNAHLPTRSN